MDLCGRHAPVRAAVRTCGAQLPECRVQLDEEGAAILQGRRFTGQEGFGQLGEVGGLARLLQEILNEGVAPDQVLHVLPGYAGDVSGRELEHSPQQDGSALPLGRAVQVAQELGRHVRGDLQRSSRGRLLAGAGLRLPVLGAHALLFDDAAGIEPLAEDLSGEVDDAGGGVGGVAARSECGRGADRGDLPEGSLPLRGAVVVAGAAAGRPV